MFTLPLDELYLRWLYGQVADSQERSRSRSYWSIFRQLYKTEFIWWVPNDDNRVEDGKQLRYIFMHELGLTSVDQAWMDSGCSFLEMLIALSGRLECGSDDSAVDWVWHGMHTLEFDIYNDNAEIPHEDVEETMMRVIHRTYRKDGYGGLFPLRHPHEDQTEIEIWAQLNAYLLENDN